MIPTAEELRLTAQRITPYIHHTPVMSSLAINERCGTEVLFKCENFQKMGAFKMRGAANAILKLSDAQKAKGVATHSSGNFAQAVALSAKMMGIKATIVMPENAPKIKKAAVLEYGAEVISCPSTQKDREETLDAFIAKSGATPLHPYNDYAVIAGQGTAAMEVLDDHPDMDILMAPVGGGGLISGTALAAHYFGKNVQTIGAEPEMANDAYLSFTTGQHHPQTNPQTMADGLRTSLGDKNFKLILEHVQHILTVSETEIVGAMRLVWERMKMIIEPSSAVPLAAVLKYPEHFKGKKTGIIVSGGNVDLGHLPF